MLKEHIQSWLDVAFVVSTNIKRKLPHMQAVYEPRQAIETNTDASVARVELVQ